MGAAEKIKPILVRPADAARMIGYGLTHFYALVKAGEIPVIKRGRTTLVEVAELERWVERQKAGA